ncbi:MAG: hypothetical protein DCC68_23385 [Planctomycetota bacterium]|nr:MAG: hypothetical protein DCC68_23385 [Planctomycetota bacterium]
MTFNAAATRATNDGRKIMSATKTTTAKTTTPAAAIGTRTRQRRFVDFVGRLGRRRANRSARARSTE